MGMIVLVIRSGVSHSLSVACVVAINKTKPTVIIYKWFITGDSTQLDLILSLLHMPFPLL